MSNILIFVIIIIGIILQIIYAFLMKKAAIQKGYGEDANIWCISFFLGILGGIYVMALPDLVQQSQNQQIIELLKEKNNGKM